MGALQPKIGKVTFESEGNEGGLYHSRKFHVPSVGSGLTIGRGYDMKMKSPTKIIQDLTAAGIDKKDATIISKASGLSGQAAKNFIKTHKLEKFEITQQQQVKLFEVSYKEIEAETIRLCTKPDVTGKFGTCNWQTLDPAMKQILVDLTYRGDYVKNIRDTLQKYVVKNDTKGFLDALSDKTNWIKQAVPPSRLQSRIDFFKASTVIKPK